MQFLTPFEPKATQMKVNCENYGMTTFEGKDRICSGLEFLGLNLWQVRPNVELHSERDLRISPYQFGQVHLAQLLRRNCNDQNKIKIL